MMETKILEKLNEIFEVFFDLDGQEITRSTTAADVSGWDSLVHIALMSEVEERFAINFTMKQILEMQNVGEMVDLIVEKGGSCE